MRYNSPSVPRRPITVTILAIGVLIIAVANMIRCWAALTYWKTLTSLIVQPGPAYIALTGLVWAATGITLFYLLWTGHRLAKMAGFFVVSLYTIYFWADRLLFQSHIPRQNNPFVIGVTILVVFYTFLSLLLPSNRAYFSRTHEQ